MDGTCTLEIAGNKIIDAAASPTLPNISILPGNTLTNNGTVTVNSFTSGGTFVNSPGSTLNFTGADLNAITVTANQCSNTINYSGTIAQTVKTMDYCNLVISSTGAKTINNGGTITVNGDATQISGTPFTIGTLTIQINGVFITGAGFVNNGDITVGNEMLNFLQHIVQRSNKVETRNIMSRLSGEVFSILLALFVVTSISVAQDYTMNGNVVNNGTIRVRRDIINNTTGLVTMSGTGVIRLDRTINNHLIRSTTGRILSPSLI